MTSALPNVLLNGFSLKRLHQSLLLLKEKVNRKNTYFLAKIVDLRCRRL
jgi:hypothetical protein